MIESIILNLAIALPFLVVLLFRKHIAYAQMLREAKIENKDTSLIEMMRALEIEKDEEKASAKLEDYLYRKTKQILAETQYK